MPYITSIERLAREEGRQEGFLEGLLEARREVLLGLIEEHFGEIPSGVREAVQGINDESFLRRLSHSLVLSAPSLAEFRKLLC